MNSTNIKKSNYIHNKKRKHIIIKQIHFWFHSELKKSYDSHCNIEFL